MVLVYLFWTDCSEYLFLKENTNAGEFDCCATSFTDICIEMQKNMFFSNHLFYAKKKVFFIEKNSFLIFFCFFQLQEDF